MASVAQNEMINEQAAGEKAMSSIGMIILLVSFSMLFLTLLMGYAVYRITSNVWPPMGMNHLPDFQAHISTGLIILSSLSFYLFQEKKNKNFLLLTLFLGGSFVLSQFQLWNALKELGIYAGSGIFASIIYGYTWTHAAHMLLGLIGLTVLVYRINKNNFKQQENLITNMGKFWHFLGVVWLIIYTLIFVI